MEFRNPYFLFLIPALLLWALSLRLFRRRGSSLRYSSVRPLRDLPLTTALRFLWLPGLLRGLALVFLILSIARPQKGLEHTHVEAEGIDIILAVDISSSMNARDMVFRNPRSARVPPEERTPGDFDLKVNRLDAAKAVVEKFIEERPDDRIGLVVFARYPYTQCPLTLDHDVLTRILEKVKVVSAESEEDGTAIGSAIAACTKRATEVPGKSRVVILLTDGYQTAGRLDPVPAAEAAKALDVKFYTVGAGSGGPAPYPIWSPLRGGMFDMAKIPMDEETLKEIARITGGEYFRATDLKSLERVYGEINELEKTTAEAEKYLEYRELFPLFLIPALCMLLVAVGLESTWLEKVP